MIKVPYLLLLLFFVLHSVISKAQGNIPTDENLKTQEQSCGVATQKENKKEKIENLSDALSFLYSNMSLADKVTYSKDFWVKNICKSLETRDKMGWNIPDREFNYFVLPVRVNNENLDEFRLKYADTLCNRVKGMSLYDAVLEINHWCHEVATYKPSDARTSSPLATIRNGYGRCGEESVLTVSALRAAGIPARQVYTPRWAHTDDNHAWVEAFVDGKWYFLGACEPEPKLNMAWFNAPASRAMLLHTKVFGRDYDGLESVIKTTNAFKEINVTANYVPIGESVVRVENESGEAVEGALVNFTIYNYAEFYTVASYKTDKKGEVRFVSGLGDMLVFGYDKNKFGFTKISLNRDEIEQVKTITLNHSIGDNFYVDFEINPPIEDPIPTDATDEEIEYNKIRFEKENIIREGRVKGNKEVIDSFINMFSDNGEDKQKAHELLNSLSVKDKNDVTLDVLLDSYSHISNKFDFYRDCPRIENEFLYPYFKTLSDSLPEISSPEQITKWINDNIKINNVSNPQRLRIPPISVWKHRVADELSRDIFFVALCRAKGIKARIDEVTNRTQYMKDDKWVDVTFSALNVESFVAKEGELKMDYDVANATIPDPIYYKHFSLSQVSENGNTVLTFVEDSDNLPLSQLQKNRLMLKTGYYLLTTGIRLANGGVVTRLQFFEIEENKKTTIPFVLKTVEDKISVIGSMDPEQKFYSDKIQKESTILSATGRGYFLIAVVGDKDEPTTHAVRQLSAISAELNEWGGAVLVLGKVKPEGLSNMIVGKDIERRIFNMLVNGVGKDSKLLPVVALCDSFGRIVYYSQGYNTSLGEELKRVLQQ